MGYIARPYKKSIFQQNLQDMQRNRETQIILEGFFFLIRKTTEWTTVLVVVGRHFKEAVIVNKDEEKELQYKLGENIINVIYQVKDPN